MDATPETVAELGAVEDALARGLPPDDVLDLADDAIERAGAAGDRSALERLATLLEGAAQARADGRGLSVAARRARALAATLAPAEVTPPETEAAAPEAPAVPEAPPPEAPADVRYAGWWQRVFAHLVDWIAILGVLTFVPIDEDSDALLFFVVALPVAYFAGMHAFVRGQTIGKALFGIAVRVRDGRPVELPAAIGRALVQGMLWVTVIGGIVDSLAPIGDSHNRALHDRLAGTVVVRVR